MRPGLGTPMPPITKLCLSSTDPFNRNSTTLIFEAGSTPSDTRSTACHWLAFGTVGEEGAKVGAVGNAALLAPPQADIARLTTTIAANSKMVLPRNSKPNGAANANLRR